MQEILVQDLENYLEECERSEECEETEVDSFLDDSEKDKDYAPEEEFSDTGNG